MAVLRQCQRCFKEISRVFKESVKCVSRKFCCCMDLIAATRAEGGYVYLILILERDEMIAFVHLPA